MADEGPEAEAAAAEPVAAQLGLPPVYALADETGELRQAEIITNLRQWDYDPTTGQVRETVRAYTILLTQDCDLLRDFESREQNLLNGLLLYEVQTYAQAKEAGRSQGRERWKIIAENNNERFHFLEPVTKELDRLGVGLPALLVDFRRFFTLPSPEIYRQCALKDEGAARRRCRLEMPYREHLQTRAAFYLQRIGLPNPHNTDAI